MEEHELDENLTDEEEEEEEEEEVTPPPRSDLDRKLDRAGWGLSFIWIGIAFLAEVGIGVGLLGVGVIILAAQLARKLLSVKVQGFWIVVGFLFVAGGLAELLGAELSWPPIVAIAAGLALIVSIFTGKCCSRT